MMRRLNHLFITLVVTIWTACPVEDRCLGPLDAVAASEIGQGLAVYGIHADDTQATPFRTECESATVELAVGAADPDPDLRVGALRMANSEHDIVSVNGPVEGHTLAAGDYVACRILEGQLASTYWCGRFSLEDGEILAAEFDFSEGASG